MKKQFALAVAMILVVVAAIVWVRVNRPADGQVQTEALETATQVVESPGSHPGEAPWELRFWIDGSLWRSGILPAFKDSFQTSTPQRRTRLWADSSGLTPVWTVDFSGLDVSVLGEHALDREILQWKGDFEVLLRVGGTRLCREEDRRLPAPMRIVSGLDSLRCGPVAQRGAVERWFRDNFRRNPRKTEFVGNEDGFSLDVYCESRDTLRALGLLRSVDFRKLRFSGCILSVEESIQMAGIPTDSLELFSIHSEIVDFRHGSVREHLSIEDGDQRWVELPSVCPPGRPDCGNDDRRIPAGLSVGIKNVPLCSQEEQSHLAGLGALLESPQCADIPANLLARREVLERDWRRLVDGDLSKILDPNHDSILLDARPRAPELRETWKMVVGINEWNDCGVGSYPRGASPEWLRGGENRIEGEFFVGPGIRISYKGQKIREGMSRDALIALLGRPSVDHDRFLAWTVTGTCSGELANLRAHFDAEGKLDAWMDHVDPECGGC